MDKKYQIEVPIYSNPMRHFVEMNKLEDIGIALYGGFPDSPFNGGRANIMTDTAFPLSRLFTRITQEKLSAFISKFYRTVTKANQNDIPFYLAFTNMFIDEEELNEDNLYPVRFLAESSRKYGLKNGIILHNKRLEEFIRERYEDELVYISSCTKYVSQHKVLSPIETKRMYHDDSGKYGYIVMTPQDSRREDIIKDVIRDNKSKITALSNIFCSNGCNTYEHYEWYSRLNKESLVTLRKPDLFKSLLKFSSSHCLNCGYTRTFFYGPKIKAMIKMQLAAGVTSFKLGRGAGQNLIDLLISLIQSHEMKMSKTTPQK